MLHRGETNRQRETARLETRQPTAINYYCALLYIRGYKLFLHFYTLPVSIIYTCAVLRFEKLR